MDDKKHIKSVSPLRMTAHSLLYKYKLEGTPRRGKPKISIPNKRFEMRTWEKFGNYKNLKIQATKNILMLWLSSNTPHRNLRILLAQIDDKADRIRRAFSQYQQVALKLIRGDLPYTCAHRGHLVINNKKMNLAAYAELTKEPQGQAGHLRDKSHNGKWETVKSPGFGLWDVFEENVYGASPWRQEISTKVDALLKRGGEQRFTDAILSGGSPTAEISLFPQTSGLEGQTPKVSPRVYCLNIEQTSSLLWWCEYGNNICAVEKSKSLYFRMQSLQVAQMECTRLDANLSVGDCKICKVKEELLCGICKKCRGIYPKLGRG